MGRHLQVDLPKFKQANLIPLKVARYFQCGGKAGRLGGHEIIGGVIGALPPSSKA